MPESLYKRRNRYLAWIISANKIIMVNIMSVHISATKIIHTLSKSLKTCSNFLFNKNKGSVSGQMKNVMNTNITNVLQKEKKITLKEPVVGNSITKVAVQPSEKQAEPKLSTALPMSISQPVPPPPPMPDTLPVQRLPTTELPKHEVSVRTEAKHTVLNRQLTDKVASGLFEEMAKLQRFKDAGKECNKPEYAAKELTESEAAVLKLKNSVIKKNQKVGVFSAASLEESSLFRKLQAKAKMEDDISPKKPSLESTCSPAINKYIEHERQSKKDLEAKKESMKAELIARVANPMLRKTGIKLS